jgi:hypothetical protein
MKRQESKTCFGLRALMLLNLSVVVLGRRVNFEKTRRDFFNVDALEYKPELILQSPALAGLLIFHVMSVRVETLYCKRL